MERRSPGQRHPHDGDTFAFDALRDRIQSEILTMVVLPSVSRPKGSSIQ